MRLQEAGVRLPQLAEDGLRRGVEVDAAEELRRELLHRPPDERPRADARRLGDGRLLGEAAAAHLDRQPRLASGAERRAAAVRGLAQPL